MMHSAIGSSPKTGYLIVRRWQGANAIRWGPVLGLACLLGCLSDAELDAPGGSISTANGRGGSESGSPSGEGSRSSSTESSSTEGGGAQNVDSLVAPDNVIAPPGDAEITDSGLASLVLSEGQGQRYPSASDTVRVHYTGWLTDGTRFDSSVARGVPNQFAVGAVIPGWVEGLQLMVEGEKRRLWIPEELAYGGIPDYPMGMLVFDLELIEILGG